MINIFSDQIRRGVKSLTEISITTYIKGVCLLKNFDFIIFHSWYINHIKEKNMEKFKMLSNFIMLYLILKLIQYTIICQI